MKFLDVIKKYDNILVKENKALKKAYQFLLKEAKTEDADNAGNDVDSNESDLGEATPNTTTSQANTNKSDDDKTGGLVKAEDFFGSEGNTEVKEREEDDGNASADTDGNQADGNEGELPIDEESFFNIAEKAEDDAGDVCDTCHKNPCQCGEAEKKKPADDGDGAVTDDGQDESCDEAAGDIPIEKYFGKEAELEEKEQAKAADTDTDTDTDADTSNESEFFESDDEDGKKKDDGKKKKDEEKPKPKKDDENLAEGLKTYVKSNKHLFE